MAIYNYQGQKSQQNLIEETSTNERINASFNMGKYPATDLLVLDFKEGLKKDLTIRLFDNSGQLILKK